MNRGWLPCVGFLTLSWSKERSVGELRRGMQESPRRAARRSVWNAKEAMEIPPCSLVGLQVQLLFLLLSHGGFLVSLFVCFTVHLI